MYVRWAALGHLKRGYHDQVLSSVKKTKKQHNVFTKFYFSLLKRLLWLNKGQKHWADWKYGWILVPAVPDWWKDQRTEGKSTWVHASIMPHIRPWHADGWSFCSSWHAAYGLRERALMTSRRDKAQLSIRSIPSRTPPLKIYDEIGLLHWPWDVRHSTYLKPSQPPPQGQSLFQCRRDLHASQETGFCCSVCHTVNKRGTLTDQFGLTVISALMHQR